MTEALGSETEAKTLMALETALRPRISVAYSWLWCYNEGRHTQHYILKCRSETLLC